jgi:hypothetical protein
MTRWRRKVRLLDDERRMGLSRPIAAARSGYVFSWDASSGLPDGWSFSRGSTKYVRGSDGYFDQVAINGAPLNYSADGLSQYLDIEAAATNILPYGNALTSWEKSSEAAVTVEGVGPDIFGNANGVFRVTDTTTSNNYIRLLNTPIIVGTQKLSLVGWIPKRADDPSYINVFGMTITGRTAYLHLDPHTGEFGIRTGSVGTAIVEDEGGFWKFALEMENLSTADVDLFINPCNFTSLTSSTSTSSLTGYADASCLMLFDGMSKEDAIKQSPIPNATAGSVARLADLLVPDDAAALLGLSTTFTYADGTTSTVSDWDGGFAAGRYRSIRAE